MPNAPCSMPNAQFPIPNSNVAASLEFLWALIGLLLTIGGTFLEASMAIPPWGLLDRGIPIHSLGVTCQVGAVLLVGCLGGKNAGALSQIAYLILGLTWLPIFTKGGGLDYLKEPTFGYLVAFIPAAWACGALAFKAPPRLEFLAFSCLCGLAIVHLIGASYLFALYSSSQELFMAATFKYSIAPLPGQLALVCAVAVIAKFVRSLLFY